MPTVQIELPALHTGRYYEGSPDQGGQVAVESHPARFKVCFCGRRWGKTHQGVHRCIRHGLDDPGRYWWVAPNYKLANEGWNLVKRIGFDLKPFMPEIEVREADKILVLPGGAAIEVRSSDSEGGLRGAGLKGVVLDEFALMRESAWTQELRPALADKQGWALFIGTPRGNNWASKLHTDAKNLPNWNSWTMWTETSPFVPLEEIESARLVMSEVEFAQEFHCDIGASNFSVYPTFNRKLHMWTKPLPDFVRFIGGLDFGGDTIGSHKSAGIMCGQTKDGLLIAIAEFEQAGPNIAERQLEWIAMCEETVRNIWKRTGRGSRRIMWAADRSQMGLIQIMQSAGIAVHKSRGGKDSVKQGIQLVQRRLERRALNRPTFYYMPNLTKLPEALERYRYPDPSDYNEHPIPDNPLKIQDDMMDALRYLIELSDLTMIGQPHEHFKNILPVVAGR